MPRRQYNEPTRNPDEHASPPSFTGEHSSVRRKSPVREVPALLCDRGFVEKLSLSAWNELLGATGEHVSKLSYDAITDLLGQPVANGLVDALDTIKALGNDDTIENLQTLERTLGRVLPATWRREDPAPDQIAHLWVVSRRDDRVANYLAIARTSRLKHSASQRMYWGEIRRPIWIAERQAEFQRALLREFEQRGYGTYLKILQARTEEKLTLYVIRPKRPRNLVCVNEEQTDRETVRVREAVCDILVYDGTLGRLEIRASRKWLAELYQTELAQAAFGERDFFGLPGAFTLDPIQWRGAAGLPVPVDDPEIVSVTLRQCVHAPSPRVKYTYQSRDDLFESLREDEVSLTRGELLEARIAFTFGVNGRERATITVRPPRHLTCPDHYRTAVMRYLQSVGIFTPKYDVLVDLWTLGDEPHSADLWARALGCQIGELDELPFMEVTRRGPAQGRGRGRPNAFRPPNLPDGLVIDDEGLLAERMDRGVVAYRPRIDSLARLLSAELVLSRCSEAPLRRGIWDLGIRQIGPRALRFYLASEEPTARGQVLEASLSTTQHSEEPVLLVPPGRDWPGHGALRVVPLEALTRPFGVVRAVVESLKLQAHLPAIDWAPDGYPLVLDLGRETAWLDGHELSLTPGQFSLLLKIARNSVSGKPTPTEGTIPPDMKVMKKQLMDAIRDVVGRGGAKQILGAGKRGRGYMLGVRSFIGG